ncbi:vacuolar protein sorting-associated protein 33 [Apiospora rasikravindrae]|uniref:Vacuolar protein sorting-associated protein 33 n=1 Tax=Apiospora rasikravindrae TaxID=990691 RepID=A0ABR1RP81_9PEZI
MYCQKCRTPLKLDNSLSELNPAAYDLLIAASSQQQSKRPTVTPPSYPQEAERRGFYDRISKNATNSLFKKQGTAHRSDGSFILLTESQLAPPKLTPSHEHHSSPHQRRQSSLPNGSGTMAGTAKPHEAERINKLFEILSARSDIDHPVCVECTDMLVDGLQKRLDSTIKERNMFADYLKQVQADVPSEEDISASEKAMEKAQRDQEEALNKLVKLEHEQEALDREMAILEEESRNLDTEEEEFWRERNSFGTKLSYFQNERDSINSKFDHDSQLLTKLQRANVYNDTFSIHHDGNFATINGLRLGRSSAKPVEWPEINAAWGQALLLVVTVADKLGYKFDGYDPLPMGSTSKIILAWGLEAALPPAPKKQVLDLFSSGDLPLNLLWHRKFDTAMVAFLELVRQLGAFVNQETRKVNDLGEFITSPLDLPYKIEGDKIGDDRIGHFSIKLGIANDDSWTKACKFALTCCKFLIAHASNVSHNANARSLA